MRGTWTGGKQRLTANQLWRLLRAGGIDIGVTGVKQYVRVAEVDFFEVLVDLAGKLPPSCATSLSGAMKHQAENIVAAMDATGLKRLVFISPMGIYGQVPGEPYRSVLDP